MGDLNADPILIPSLSKASPVDIGLTLKKLLLLVKDRTPLQLVSLSLMKTRVRAGTLCWYFQLRLPLHPLVLFER